MKTKLSVMLAAAGVAAVLLTSCVSSKKYKSSQAMLQQVRDDSTRLAQQVASLNENVNSLQQKNTTLQRSLDSSTSSYASQQKDLNYYQDYFNQQQTAMTQVSDHRSCAGRGQHRSAKLSRSSQKTPQGKYLPTAACVASRGAP